MCFLHRERGSLPVRRHPTQHLSTTLGGNFLRSKITYKKLRNVNNVAPHRSGTGQVCSQGTRRQSIVFFPSAGNMRIEWLKYLAALSTSVNDCEWTVSADFRITDKLQWEIKFTNTESMTNENQLFIYTVILTLTPRYLPVCSFP